MTERVESSGQQVKISPWHHLFDLAVEAVAEVLPGGRLGYVNPAFRQLFNALGEEFRGTDWTRLFAPPEEAPLQEALDRALSEGTSRLEAVRIRPDTAGHVNLALARLRMTGTEEPTIAVVVRRARGGPERLGDSGLADLSARQPAAVLLIDPAGFIVDVDDEEQGPTFGQRRLELLGRPWTDLFRSAGACEEPREEEAAALLDELAGRGDVQALGRRTTGKIFAARLRVSRRADEERGYLMLVQDVTPLPGLESALEASELQTRVALQELQLLENAFDQHAIVAITDRAGRILYANDKFCQLSRYSREELLGQDHRIINSGYHPKSFFRNLWGTIGRGETWHGEIRNRAKDGTIYWVDTTIVPMESAGERRYISIRTDITERKRMQAQLVQAAKMAAIGELAGHIAHEVNNPIGIISAKARLILSDLAEELSPRLERDLGKIVAQCDRLSRLTRGLLDFARPSLGTRAALQIHEALKRVIDLVSERIRKEGGEFEVELAEELPPVRGNPGELEQVFLNLMLNAIDAIPAGGRIRVTTSAEAWHSDGRPAIAVRIEDDGHGMSEEVRHRIFEPFFTTKEPGRGTGLGLSICQGLIRSHEGELSVESAPGRGAAFEVRLPVAESTQEEPTTT